MAPSELAEIRALLVAQSETVEVRRPPRLLGIVGSLLKPRPEPPRAPLSLNPSPPASRWRDAQDAPFGHDEDALLLLGEEIDPDLFEPLDLPPPPRGEFGVRSPRPYLPHDSVLLLNKRAPAQPRRLTLLTDTGEAVGEIYLKPDAPTARTIYNAAHLGNEHEAPYFPGDLEDGADVLSLAVPAAAADSSPGPTPPEVRTCNPAPLASPPTRPGLGRDLLQALALTLAREHEALCDRLMVCASQ